MALQSRPLRLNGGAADAVSDEVLAAQAATLADTAAFETLVRRHERRIFYLHNRFTRDAALAEDLCQETFLRAWCKLATFSGHGAFAGWLTRLAYNVFLQHRRRQGARPDTTPLDTPGGRAAEAATAMREPVGEPDLERLLAVVTEEEQRLLILAYGAGMSTAEIGALLGTSTGTVKSKIHRAKQKIREHFHIEATS